MPELSSCPSCLGKDWAQAEGSIKGHSFLATFRGQTGIFFMECFKDSEGPVDIEFLEEFLS